MKPSHRVFVNEFLRTGDQVKAYQKAYHNVSDSAARSAANRLLQDPEIAYFINNVYDEVKEEVMAEFRDRMVELYDLKVHLSQMIRREVWQEREVKSKDGTMILHNQPGFAQVLRAGHMLCLLEGWYKSSAEKESERAKEDPGADESSSLQEEDVWTEDSSSMRERLWVAGKENEAYLKEIETEDESGILAELLAAVRGEGDLEHLDEFDLLEMRDLLETKLEEREQLQDHVDEIAPETELQDAEKENKNIDLLQQITTKSFAADSKPIICDFTTKPQKTMRIAIRKRQ